MASSSKNGKKYKGEGVSSLDMHASQVLSWQLSLESLSLRIGEAVIHESFS